MARQLPKNRPPTHPGEMLADFLEDLGITQTDFAEAIDVSRVRVNELIRGRRAVTPSTALRLERALGKPAYWWLELQQNFDLWQALHSDEMEAIQSLKPLVAT